MAAWRRLNGVYLLPEPKILIVDDDEDVIQALRVRLETAGYQVVTAANGVEALAILQKEKISLVVADFMMPELDGLALTRLVRRNPVWVDIKVMLFSCNTAREYRQSALELGAVDYLSKLDGASSIVHRVYDLLGPAQDAGVEPEITVVSASEYSVARRLRVFSQEIAAFLRQARQARDLPPGTLQALDGAERLAEELDRLANLADDPAMPREAERSAAT